MTAPAKPHRWMQFNLRTLLIGLVGCAMVLGFIGREVSRRRARTRNFQAMQKVLFKFRDLEPRVIEWRVGAHNPDFENVQRNYCDSNPEFIIWARHYAHSPPARPSTYWGLEDTAVGASDLAHLCSWAVDGAVTGINLANTAIGDEGLEQLAHHAELRILILDSTSISSEGIQHLMSLQGLRYLSLRQTDVQSTAIDELRRHLPHCWVVQ
jgi:hypothetical protein